MTLVNLIYAVLISPDDEGVKDWQIDVLSNTHNGDNEAEIERIRAEHPDEPECVLNRRVLGALAPTRCEYLVLIFILFSLFPDGSWAGRVFACSGDLTKAKVLPHTCHH